MDMAGNLAGGCCTVKVLGSSFALLNGLII